MKKSLFIIFLLICMVLAGCSSTQTASEPEEGDMIALPAAEELAKDPFNRNILGAVDEDLTRDHFLHNKETIPETADDLSFDDFEFYYDNMYDGIPEDAYFPAVKYAEGIWKYDLIFREDTSVGGYYFDELGYAEFEINYDTEQFTITLHPRLENDGYESSPTNDAEIGYEPFTGGFDENDNFRLYGNNCVLDCQMYYFSSGREYFMGELWISEESFGVFLMTRGQN